MDNNNIQLKAKGKVKTILSNKEDFSNELLKQQSDFNQLIEKALEIDIDKKFDVKKYLPKNTEQYSSKILRKYQGVLNKKEYAHQSIMMSMKIEKDNDNNNENDMSNIKNECIIGDNNDTTFNYNFMPTQPNKNHNFIDEDIKNIKHNDNIEYNEPFFSVYVEEIQEKIQLNIMNTNEYSLRKEVENDIERLNYNIYKSYCNINDGQLLKKDRENYIWYCLDYDLNSDAENIKRTSIEENFLNYER